MSKRMTSIGLMSGTSLDGIDVALITTDGESDIVRGPCQTIAYTAEQRRLLTQSLQDAILLSDRIARPGVLKEAEAELTHWHAAAVKRFIAEHRIRPSQVDVIGFHGQTVIHRPERQLTVQLGDGPLLARETGLAVVYDLRAHDVETGGQGAPLVPVYHKALASQLDELPCVFLNIGGVSNVTYVDSGTLIAFDTGPGNALIDDFVHMRTGQMFDVNGALAAVGQVDEATVVQFLGHPFFKMKVPKSLDRNAFKGVSLDGLSVADGAATLVAVTVRSVFASLQHFPKVPAQWIVCGGGRMNAEIMGGLNNLPGQIRTAEVVGLNGDSMEAEAWAYLAVRSLLGNAISFPLTTGVARPTTGGVLALP